MTDWPNDADGDVFRRLECSGFDFARQWTINFDVDLDRWPPPSDAVSLLARKFPGAVVHAPSGEGNGYVQFQVHAQLTYALVTRIQSEVSSWLAPWGGVCESWGVLH